MPIPLLVYGALAAFQVISGNQQAATIEAQANLKQRIDNLNADRADIDAYEAEKFGFTESARYQSVVDATAANQKVAYASQNVDVNYGTAADVQGETRLTGLLNTLEIQRQAREKAAGFKNQARNLRLGGGMAAQQGAIDANATRNQGYIGAAGTLLSGYSRNSSSTDVALKKDGAGATPGTKTTDSGYATDRWGTQSNLDPDYVYGYSGRMKRSDLYG